MQKLEGLGYSVVIVKLYDPNFNRFY